MQNYLQTLFVVDNIHGEEQTQEQKTEWVY
jgi:hypothetical protein